MKVTGDIVVDANETVKAVMNNEKVHQKKEVDFASLKSCMTEGRKLKNLSWSENRYEKPDVENQHDHSQNPTSHV